MTRNHWVRFSLAAVLLVDQSVLAEEYDYEISVSLSQVEADSTSVTAFGLAPITSTVDSSSETDAFSLRGTWFYSGLSDDEGPKSRAAFIDRASSLSINYTQSDQSSNVSVTRVGLPSFEASSSIDTSVFAVDLRRVWKNSGWFGLLGVGRASFDGEFTVDTLMNTEDDDSTVYAAGFGKYVADTTSLDFRLVSQDVGGSTASGVSLNFNHLGKLGENWMYGADLGWTRTDTSGDGYAYSLRGSLYPNADLDFGVGYSRRDSERGIDAEAVDVSVGWFLSDKTRIRASYREDTSDASVGVELYGFEIGFSTRF